MFGPGGDIIALRRALETLTGPLTEERPFGEVNAWWLRGGWRGQPTRVAIATEHQQLRGVITTADLAGHPVSLSVRQRGMNLVLGVPEVRTGDAEFDRVFVVNGWPAEALQAALDAPTRRLLLDEGSDRHTWIASEGGTLFVQRTLRAGSSPEELARGFDLALNLAAALAAAFRQELETIARQQGREAASRWAAGLVDLSRQRGDRRAGVRALLFAIVGGTIAVILIAVVALLVWKLT